MSLTARPTPAGRMPKYAPGISAPYGFSSAYKDGKVFHNGQDYFWLNADPAGSRKVYAAGAGVVTKVFSTTTMGGMIEISHGSFSTRYNHMPVGSSRVKVGDRVTMDTYLGPMGNAGTAANGQYHLHFEVWVNGTRTDPEPYFTSTAGGDVTPIESDDDMAHMELVQTPDGTVWFCYDRIFRYAIPASRNLDTYRAFMTALGKSTTLIQKSAVDINAYGSPVYADPLGRFASNADASAILSAISNIKVEGGGTIDYPTLAAEIVKLITPGATPADVKASADRIISAIPTALQNGAAARSAIVKP